MENSRQSPASKVFHGYQKAYNEVFDQFYGKYVNCNKMRVLLRGQWVTRLIV